MKIINLAKNSHEKGFTLTELTVTVFLFVTLLGLATISLVGAKQRTVLSTTIEILLSDMRQQQLKAMVGDAGTGANPDTYGLHFTTNSYILFKGPAYIASDPNNFVINLGDNIQVTNSPSDILFQRVTGEVSTSGSIIFSDLVTKTIKTLQYNKYGTVTSVN